MALTADSVLHVVIAPDSFKGSVSATEAVSALSAGWTSARPDDVLTGIPVADGGEGTLDVFIAALPGARRHSREVTGPDGRPVVDAAWLELPDGSALVELACVSGLPLMAEPDPLRAQTVGLGELIGAALDVGSRQVLVALGGSASTDGGTGLLTALGARFLDDAGNPLPPGGGSLIDLARVDLSGLRPPPAGGVQCLVDVDAPLLGPKGAAAVFGPQKGADPADVQVLDRGLARLAEHLGGDPATPGAGAAGGTAYGLAAAWDAQLVPGAQTIASRAGLTDALVGADLVITGEGRFDRTSLTGKVVGGVIELASTARVPVLLVAGQISDDPPSLIRSAVALVDLAGGLEPALADPQRWLHEAGRRLGTHAATRSAGHRPWSGTRRPHSR